MQSTPIRLLKILTSFQIGGTERQFTNIARQIDAKRFDLHVGCLRNVGPLLHEIEGLAVPRSVFHIGKLYSVRTLWQAIRLALYIRKHRIQIVHTYGFYCNVFAVPAAKLAGCSLIIASIRDTGDVLTASQRLVQKLACRWAACILVNAEAVRESLVQQGYRPDNIVVIKNGILLSRFSKQASAGNIRGELGLPPEAAIVVVFSRLNQMKGVEYFLAAAAKVAAQLPDVRFLIVGDGAHRKELEQQAAQMGLSERTVFAGFRTDVPELLSEAALSVLPSLSEGLSNSLLESMACGVPVVAACVGGNPEVIEPGVCGLLVPARDSGALAEAMIRILSDSSLRERFGEAGQRRVKEVFSMDRSICEVQNLYERLWEAHAHQ